jgi:hypothetical protein
MWSSTYKNYSMFEASVQYCSCQGDFSFGRSYKDQTVLR